jgi:cytochrome c oxidase cbb3-type subunit I
MEQFQSVVKKHFYFSFLFFALGLIFGLVYSVNLLGFSVNSIVFEPQNMRSIHISLMLYGFIPLMLSYLPFFLIVKDVGYDAKAVRFLEVYTIIWYIFLIAMVFSILMGVRRGLSFYDFHYSLNGILALAGFFYILALFRYINIYEKKPTWIKVSLFLVVIAPFALLILMNPVIGQVEATIGGPHGDNTLGMSFALLPIYYLIIKYLSKNEFKARWHIFWIIPGVFYALSVAHRVFIGHLSYDQEWFFQWLTFFYVPLLYRWYKDANIEPTSKRLLLISIVAFLFVDIEGNILFIESIRWVFHRNDLVVAHAHIAMGVGVLFMTLSFYGDFIKELTSKLFSKVYLIGMIGMLIVLSSSGLVQAGYIQLPIDKLWLLRTGCGLIILSSTFLFVKLKTKYTALQTYNLIGILNDGFGAIFLFLFADFLYPLVGFRFDGVYEYVVFGFVSTTGIIHYLALKFKEHEEILTKLTVIVRSLMSSIFLALFLSNRLGIEALIIFSFDFIFALFYIVVFYKRREVAI